MAGNRRPLAVRKDAGLILFAEGKESVQPVKSREKGDVGADEGSARDALTLLLHVMYERLCQPVAGLYEDAT